MTLASILLAAKSPPWYWPFLISMPLPAVPLSVESSVSKSPAAKMNMPLTFGSHGAAVSQSPPPVSFTQSLSWLSMLNVPERMSAPWPTYVASLAVLVALPSMKIEPLIVSFFVVALYESSSGPDLQV